MALAAEPVKDPFEAGRGDATAVVAHLDQRAVAVTLRRESDGAAVIGVPGRIVEEIAEHSMPSVVSTQR